MKQYVPGVPSMSSYFEGLARRYAAGQDLSDRDWGLLYGVAGSALSSGSALPEELRQVVAARLAALCAALTCVPVTDVRAKVLAAVAPRSRPRVVGPKGQVSKRARIAAEAAADMLAVDSRRGRVTSVVAAVVAKAGIGERDVQGELAKVRAARKSREKPG